MLVRLAQLTHNGISYKNVFWHFLWERKKRRMNLNNSMLWTSKVRKFEVNALNVRIYCHYSEQRCDDFWNHIVQVSIAQKTRANRFFANLSEFMRLLLRFKLQIFLINQVFQPRRFVFSNKRWTMAANDWKREMDHMLEMFDRQATLSLRKINGYFGTLRLPFNEEFRQHFLKISNQR